jgi:3-hydroxyisobutyrate dehydrogenase
MAATRPVIAVLGLGTMGAGMAHNLCAAGFPVVVYNRNAARTAPFAGIARVATSPADAARGADIVLSMLTDDLASDAVWFGPAGALEGVAASTICIESSTVSPDFVARWARRVTAAGGEPLDAPVTGSKLQAEGGQLVFVVGGSADALVRATPALQAMSKAIVHLGPSGSGTMFKLINNFLGGAQAASLAEAITMIERSGIDPRLGLQTLVGGSPGSPMVRQLAERILADDYSANFQLGLQAKDIGYALAEAERMGMELATGRTAAAIFAAGVEAGHGAEDIAAVVKAVRAADARG